MFYYKVIENGKIAGYLETEEKENFSNFVAIDEEEYNKAILQLQEEMKEAATTPTVQDMVVQEQAQLLTMRANSKELSSEDAAYIENRLDAISDYWDSKEGQVAVYGTD